MPDDGLANATGFGETVDEIESVLHFAIQLRIARSIENACDIERLGLVNIGARFAVSFGDNVVGMLKRRGRSKAAAEGL